MALPSLLLPAACSQKPGAPSEPDVVLLKARAMQALVCVQLERVPASWKSDVRLSGPAGRELWQTLSEQPLMDHGQKISSVYQFTTGQLFLAIQGGFPETLAIYGPLPDAPQCKSIN